MTQSQTGHGDMARYPVRSPGLTLPELLISLSLMSIMAFTALNFLPPLIHSSRMSGEVNRFVVALQLARSEAVKQGRRLVLCPQKTTARLRTRRGLGKRLAAVYQRQP